MLVGTVGLPIRKDAADRNEIERWALQLIGYSPWEMEMKRRGIFGLAGALVTAVITAGSRANTPAGSRKRGYADGPFGLVHFHDNGADGLPLILCHQSPQSARQFDEALPELAKRGIRAIAVDTPGFGMSEPTPFVPKIEDYAKAIPAVMDHLHIAKTNILGHHTGAVVATEVALQFPNRILKLILNGAHPMDEDERRRGLENNVNHEQNFLYQPDGTHLSKNFVLRSGMYGPGCDANYLTRAVCDKFMGYGPFWYGHHAAYSYSHNDSLPKIKHQAMILTNTGDQIYRNAQIARKIRPDFVYTELQGGTIDITVQQTAAWADSVAAFLRSRGSRAHLKSLSVKNSNLITRR